MDIPWIFLFLLLIYCDGQKLELEKKERLAKVLEDIRAKIISDDDSEYVEGSGVGNDEQFVANLVVRPGFPVDKHKPTLQFMPHFENDFFEFMVPEGVSDKPGVMAILLFYGILDSSLPEFSLSGNGSEFLEIGDLTVTQTQNYALIEVPILKQGNLNLPYSNGSFLLTITAKQKGMENKANLLVEIIPVTGVEFLSIRPGSLDLTQGQDYVDEDVASGEAPAEVAPKVQGPPVIEIVVKGAKDGIFSVSESLLRFSRVPGVEIEVNVRNYSNPTDYIELSLEPSDVFAARPQMVSPGEPVQLVVLDSNALDFEATPKELHFKLNARLRGKFKSVAKESVHLVAEKVDESDQPPVFERERYMFGIDTEWKHDSEVGEVKAVDLDSAQNIQYTLLGHGSQKFKLHNGILYVDCGMSEKCFDKGHEYHLLALAVDQTGQTSKPASIMIKVESTVSEECYIEVPSKELTVRNGKLQYPFNFVVNNIRRSIIPKFTVKLDGKAKKYFEIEALTKRLHNLKLIQEIPDGKYSLDLVLGQKSGKQRTRITVVSKNESQVKFKKHNHTVTLATVKTGLAVLTVDLTGKRPKHVKFVINGITSNWVSINPKSGQVTVTQTPKASETLRFTVTAYNTKTGKILDEATVTLKYKGEKPVEADTSSKVLYYHKEGLKFKKDRSLKTQKIVGYNHNRQQVVVSDGKYNGSPNGDMYISYDLLKMFNYMQVFFAGPFDKQVIYTLLNEDPSNNRKPVFVSPWMSDFEEITVTDVPSDSHRDIICLPCVYNGHTIGNVTLTSDLNVVYSTKTGCLHTFEKIQGEHKIRLECYNDDEKTTATIKLATVATVNSVQLKDKTVTISENENSTVIAKYSVPNASKFKFELSGENSDLFYVTVTADEVTVKASSKLNFDFEDTKSYALFVTVVDSSGGRKTALLLITVLDVNDNYPVITVVPKVLHTYSHWTKDVTVTSIRARDADSGDNGKLQYEILEASFLKIDRTSGIVTVSEDLEPFGREEPYIVTLKVADHGDPAKSTILDIPVYVHTVIEAFDKQIEILSPSENCIVEISEDEKINSTVFNAKAVLKGMDLDDALLKYYIKPESESASDFLQMDEETGDMRLLKLLDYEELSHLTVRLEVKSLLSGVPAAFRLLNVTVINVDDNQPEFTLTETERIISNETVQIRAWDDDLSPYNNIYYYLLPKCGSTRYVKIGEETGLLELDKDVPDGTKLCVYASSVQLVDDLDSLYYDKFNKAMVKLTVQKSDITLSSTWVLLDSDLKNQQIDLKLLDTGSELQYHVEDIQFYPMKGHAVSVNDLISIDEKTGILLLDPRIVDEPEGTYQVTVTIKGQTTYNQDIFVYYIRDYNKLRFVFDNNKDNVGLNLEAFRSQLQVILSSQRRKNVTIVDSEVCGAVEVNQRKRTHVCFFLTEHNKVLDSENGLDWLSTTLNANPRLIDLYSKFRVIDVDKCINLNSLLLHSSTTVLDREQLVWLSVILALVAVLVVLVAYSCLVKRVKDKRVVFEGTVVTRE